MVVSFIRSCRSLVVALGSVAALGLQPATAVAQPSAGASGASAAESAGLDTSNLPDVTAFLNEIKGKLRSDERLQLQYTFRETVTEREHDRGGRLTKTTTKVYEVFPAEDIGYRRLVLENGRPVDASVLAREDEKQRKKVEEYVASRQHETPEARAKRLAAAAREEQKQQRDVDELFRVMQARILGRDRQGARPRLVVAVEPRPNVKPSTTAGKVFRSLQGRAWFDESTRELIRADLQFIDNVSFGLGLLARIYKGSNATFERRMVDADAWLPVRYSFVANGRLMLFKGIRLDTDVEFSDYRRATALTSEAFQLPKKPSS